MIGAAFFVVAGAAAAGGWYAGRQESTKNDSKKTAASDSEKTADDTKETDDNKPDSGSKKVTVTLYFSDSNAEYLIPEQREISVENEADVYQAAVKALIKGPADAGHVRTIPEAMSVENLSLTDGVLSIDFSSTLLSQFPKGSTAENLFIYSIVNTLTEFPQVKGVRFLVGGQTVSSRDINTDLTQVFPRNQSLIAK